MKKEIWVDVKGYEGFYQISNLGRVKRLERESEFGKYVRVLKEKVMTPNKNRHGYNGVNFVKEGETKAQSIHRLVANHFVPNPNKLPEVNHVDGDKDNNEYTNLEWCTRAQNMMHAYEKGLIDNYGANSPRAKLTEVEVAQIRERYASGRYTYEDLANEFNVGGSTIGRIIRGEVYASV